MPQLRINGENVWVSLLFRKWCSRVIDGKTFPQAKKGRQVDPAALRLQVVIALFFRVRCPHGPGKFLDLAQVLGHLVPAIPVGIVGVHVEKPLVGAHTMLHVHLDEDLVDVG